jgi:hypothetical protein
MLEDAMKLSLQRTLRPRPPVVAACLGLASLALLGTGWDLLRKPDQDVEKGNRLVRKGQPKPALEAYQKAERRLGRRQALDYDEGLAYFGLGDLAKAREAFLAAAGTSDEKLRRRALYNLANTAYREGERSLKPAAEALAAIKQAEEQIAAMGVAPEKKAERCQALAMLAKAFEAGTAKLQGVAAAFGPARDEYRQVLRREPGHFDAKWNLELTLRQIGEADRQVKALSEKAASLKKRMELECPDESKDKKDQDKKDQDKKDQDKKDQDKKDQDKKDQDKKDQDKKDQDKKDQDKKDPGPKDAPQEQLSKEDVEKQKAGEELDRLEQKQKEAERRRARQGLPRRPDKDW